MNQRLATPAYVLALACALVAGAPIGALAQRSREPVTLNFVNADIEAVARTMASIIGRNIVVDPRVKGTISLSTEKPVAPSVAYNQFLSAVRLSGYTIVESAGLLKLVPEADAKLQGGTVSTTPVAGNQIVTQIFRLSYEPAANLVPILRPLISPNNTINVSPGNNSLVITDYADNLQRIARIIAALDVSNATDVEVMPLKHQLAPDIAPVVQRLVDSSGSTVAVAPGQGQADSSFRTTVIAETRSNSLLVRASNGARMNLVRSIVEKLDQPSTENAAGNIYVVYLKNAEATKLAVTLRAALQAASPGAGGGGGGTSSAPATSQSSGGNANAGASAATAPIAASAQPSTGGQIQADPATNSLIITAAEPQYRQIRAVIDRLDQRRAQVYVEGLIADVNANVAAEFGIQWQGPVTATGNRTVGLLGTNFSATSAGGDLISLAAQGSTPTQAPGAGLNFATVSRIAGGTVLTSLAHFLQTTGGGNVLSTPNLLTLDNEEAKIVVGRNVPFVTGQYTSANTGTNGTVNPFQTIERKDIGLTLRIKPQISESGTVKLQIFQEVSDIDNSVTSASGLITTKNSIESNVLVDDGAIVVLGGLLKDSYTDGESKVPLLGDVPLLGNLFKTQNRGRTKTNLMVFLRPVVIRDATQSDAISLDRYDLMRAAAQQLQPKPSILTPVNEVPAMEPVKPAPAVVRPGAAPAPLTYPSVTK